MSDMFHRLGVYGSPEVVDAFKQSTIDNGPELEDFVSFYIKFYQEDWTPECDKNKTVRINSTTICWDITFVSRALVPDTILKKISAAYPELIFELDFAESLIGDHCTEYDGPLTEEHINKFTGTLIFARGHNIDGHWCSNYWHDICL